MILLQTQNVARHFGATILFNRVNVEIQTSARIGLVGRNGAGKSTLLHILAGQEEPDEGRVSKRKGITIGFLDQHTGLQSNRTIWDEMLTVFEPILQMEKEMRDIEQQLSSPALQEHSPKYQELLQTYAQLQEEFSRRGGYGYDSEIKMVLHGFRFYEKDYETPINQLSGGQKTRLALARLLLQKKDLLVLDEPTNHLDIETLSWLEGYLKKYDGALLIVSHDRYFLDKVVTEIYEVSRRRVQHFPGNYSNYLKRKSDQIQKLWKDYEKQQKEIAKMEDFINRNLVRASTTKRAQSRRKQLEKMDKMDRPQGDEKSAHFSFQVERESGDIVIQSSNLAIGYEDEPLSEKIDLDIRKGEAVALVGPNGVGKTTLLKTLVSQLKPLDGTIEFGTKVDTGYYDQEQQHLNTQKTVLTEVWDDHPTTPEQDIRTLLGSFLFTGEEVDKSIPSLSGGERARVALAKLAMEKNNFLILDEPTNHLDIDSKEVLENALIDFTGTLLFVSHDRYFINRMASKVMEISEEGVTVYLGDYDYYLQKKEELEALAAEKAKVNNEPSAKQEQSLPENPGFDREAQKEQQRIIRRLSREIAALEDELQGLERKIDALQQELNDPAIYEDPEYATKLTKQNQEMHEQQTRLLEKWETASLELEEYSD